MQVSKSYDGVEFPIPVIRRAFETLEAIIKESGVEEDEDDFPARTHTFSRGDESWDIDSIEEWYAEVANLPMTARYHAYQAGPGLYVLDYTHSRQGHSTVRVRGNTKAELQRLINVFNDAVAEARLPAVPEPEYSAPPPVVFLGHGHSGDWRKIKDHLQDKQGYTVEAYEVGARAGHTIRDVLDSMLSISSIAFLVMSAEDQQADGGLRARQNVVHEAGLFQGRLGFARAIAVIEDGVEVFSNLAGVDQIRYPANHVEVSFGEILATIRREFGDARELAVGSEVPRRWSSVSRAAVIRMVGPRPQSHGHAKRVPVRDRHAERATDRSVPGRDAAQRRRWRCAGHAAARASFAEP